jgi:hypothetical protein
MIGRLGVCSNVVKALSWKATGSLRNCSCQDIEDRENTNLHKGHNTQKCPVVLLPLE